MSFLFMAVWIIACPADVVRPPPLSILAKCSAVKATTIRSRLLLSGVHQGMNRQEIVMLLGEPDGEVVVHGMRGDIYEAGFTINYDADKKMIGIFYHKRVKLGEKP